MAAFIPFNGFLAAVASGNMDFGNDQLAMTMCAEANAPTASDSIIGDLTPISFANLDGDLLLTTSSAGTVDTDGYRVVVADKQLLASGGDIGPFRYVVVYDQTTHDLICYYDLADNITIPDTTAMNFDFSQVVGLFQIQAA